ncbi:MAG: hypothetical protein R3F30_10560 [Planctomycetota bacterium]
MTVRRSGSAAAGAALVLVLGLVPACGKDEPPRPAPGGVAPMALAAALERDFGGCDAAEVAAVAEVVTGAFEAGRVGPAEVVRSLDFLGFAEVDRLLARLAVAGTAADATLLEALAPELEARHVARLAALCRTPLRARAVAILGALLERCPPSTDPWPTLPTDLGLAADAGEAPGLQAVLAALCAAPDGELAPLAPAAALALARAAPGSVPTPLLVALARAEVGPRLRRTAIRGLGLVDDAAGRAALAAIVRGDGDADEVLLALTAQARLGDAEARKALDARDEPLARALRLDLDRERGYEAVYEDIAAADPWTFEQALLLVEQLDERAWEGFVDPRGLVPGRSLPPLLCSPGFPLARTLAVVHAVPGCRTVEVARAILGHAEFAELPRLVELDGPRIEVLAFLEVAAGEELTRRMRAAARDGPERLRPYWSARLAELGDEAAVETGLVRLAADPGDPAAPSLARLAVHAPERAAVLARRTLEVGGGHGERVHVEALQALAIAGGVPFEAGFPHPADLDELGEAAAGLEQALVGGDVAAALRGFLAGWRHPGAPYCSVAALGLDRRWRALLGEADGWRAQGLHPQVLAGLALTGDEAAAAAVRDLREAGRVGFLRLADPLARTAALDPAQCRWWLERLSSSPERGERTMAEVLPLYGLHLHPRMWPERRALRLDLAGGRVLPSRLSLTCVPAPDVAGPPPDPK